MEPKKPRIAKDILRKKIQNYKYHALRLYTTKPQ